MDFFKNKLRYKRIRESFIFIILLWILLSTLVGFGSSSYYNLYYENQQESSVQIVKPFVEDYLEVLTHLEQFFIQSEEVTYDEFQNYCGAVCGFSESIDAVMYSPLGIVTYVNPSSEEDTYVDVDLVSQFTPHELELFQNAKNQNEMFVTFSDDESFTIHKVLVEDDVFIGLVSVKVNIEQFQLDMYDALPSNDIVLKMDGNYIIGDQSEKIEHYHIRSFMLSGISFDTGTNFNSDYRSQIIWIAVVIDLGIILSLGTILVLLYRDHKRVIDFVDRMDYTYHYDLNTELKNKTSLYEDFERLKEEHKDLYIAYGVFNNVKFINFKYGHELGLSVVKEAITLIHGVLRAHTQMYHLGGDEYAFIFEVDNANEVKNIINRVLRVFERDIVIKKIRTNISLSLGVVHYPNEGRELDELIRNAHLALTQSRIINSNNYAFYSSTAITDLINNQDFDDYVSKLDLNVFQLYLMPIVHVQTNQIVGFECLTRAFNEFDELMDTFAVVSSLERNGRIQELDEIVFRKMLTFKEQMNELYPNNNVFLSVNASALSFNEDYVETIIQDFQLSRMKPNTIILELTESYKIEDHDYLIKLFKRLNNIGIRTAIDDFGSGYSSLSYISKFPIYSIKVDKMYVRDYQQNEFNRTLFLTLSSIAEVLHCKLIAEGVDDPETLDFLRENGCEWYQGFLFSKGVPFDKAIKMLQSNQIKTDKE